MSYVIRTNGGPHPGTRSHPGPWPLPDRLEDEGGHYAKTSESQLPPEMDEHPNIMRGAEYEWRADT